MPVLRLSDIGREKLARQIAAAGQPEATFDATHAGLVDVVNNQIAGPVPAPPWYFAIGVAGTTYPTTLEEEETSDYREVCWTYEPDDVVMSQ